MLRTLPIYLYKIPARTNENTAESSEEGALAPTPRHRRLAGDPKQGAARGQKKKSGGRVLRDPPPGAAGAAEAQPEGLGSGAFEPAGQRRGCTQRAARQTAQRGAQPPAKSLAERANATR